jgi:hypothetical protein
MGGVDGVGQVENPLRILAERIVDVLREPGLSVAIEQLLSCRRDGRKRVASLLSATRIATPSLAASC